MAGAFLERLLVTLACGSLCDIRPALGIVRCGSKAELRRSICDVRYSHERAYAERSSCISPPLISDDHRQNNEGPTLAGLSLKGPEYRHPGLLGIRIPI